MPEKYKIVARFTNAYNFRQEPQWHYGVELRTTSFIRAYHWMKRMKKMFDDIRCWYAVDISVDGITIDPWNLLFEGDAYINVRKHLPMGWAPRTYEKEKIKAHNLLQKRRFDQIVESVLQ